MNQTKNTANQDKSAGSNGEQEPVVIKRYASRKLYDAAAKEYVTLEDIARYIRNGREVQIIDKKTGEDLTRQYLIQIIADFESQGESALPLNVLTDLVRHYQDQARNMTPAFLSQAFEAFKEQQEKMMDEFGELGGKVFDPQATMENIQSWQARQAEFFGNAMKGWTGLNDRRESDADVEKTENTTVSDPANNSDEDGKTRKIREMEAHLKALQEELNRMR